LARNKQRTFEKKDINIEKNPKTQTNKKSRNKERKKEKGKKREIRT
jgi:hypothetical protein